MEIVYKIKNAKGYAENLQSVFIDVEKGVRVVFSNLPSCECYLCIYDEKGASHNLKLINNAVDLPNFLLKAQLLNINLIEVADGEIIDIIQCESLKIRKLGQQCEIAKTVDFALCEELRERHIVTNSEIGMQAERIASLQETLKVQQAQIDSLREIVSKQNEKITFLSDVNIKLVKQIELIENKYSILDTIGGM